MTTNNKKKTTMHDELTLDKKNIFILRMDTDD